MTDKIEIPQCFARLVAAAKGLSHGGDWNNGPANAAHTAACDPDTIRALLAEHFRSLNTKDQPKC